jgi:hypothetical protein
VEYHDRTPAEQRAVLESVGLLVLLVDVLLGLDDLTWDNLFAEPSRTVLNLTGSPAVGRGAGARTHHQVRASRRRVTPSPLAVARGRVAPAPRPTWDRPAQTPTR